MDKSTAASELSPSPFGVSPTAKFSAPGKEDSVPRKENRTFLPKFPTFKRSSTKTTPFILKRVSTNAELERPTPAPVSPVAGTSDPLMPFVVSPITVVLPARPVVISPVYATDISAEAVRGFDIPQVISPTVVQVPRQPHKEMPIVAPKPSLAAPAVSIPASSVSAPKISAVNSRISLEDINREFTRSRAYAAKTRRRRFRSPLINGEIREELKDEYYWEILSDRGDVRKHGVNARLDDPLKDLPPRRGYSMDGSHPSAGEKPWEPNLITAILVESVIFVGHTTLLTLGPFRRLMKMSEGGAPLSEEMNRLGAEPDRKKKGKGIRTFDVFFAVICGIAIGVLGVFPVLKMFSTEIYRSIRLSNVRKLSHTISVSEEGPSVLQLILDPVEILGEIDGHLITQGDYYSDAESSETDAPPLSPETDGSQAEFDDAKWSGALLNEFESPETESYRRGEQK
jgi:hypothetical protein